MKNSFFHEAPTPHDSSTLYAKKYVISPISCRRHVGGRFTGSRARGKRCAAVSSSVVNSSELISRSRPLSKLMGETLCKSRPTFPETREDFRRLEFRSLLISFGHDGGGGGGVRPRNIIKAPTTRWSRRKSFVAFR